MRKNMKKIFVSLILSVFVLNMFGMPMAEKQMGQVAAATNTTTSVINSKVATGKVSVKKLYIRASKSASSKKLKTVKKGTKVTILSTGTKWVKVSVNGVIGYAKGKSIKTTYGTASHLYSKAISGKVTKATLKIHTSKSKSASSIITLTKGTKVKVLTTNSKWVKIKYGDKIGYVLGKHVKTASGTASNNLSKGQSLVAYAKRFLGNPYVWGGSSLTHGADCSGFVMALYKHYGYSLPHSSYAQRSVGRAVSGGIKNARPGDIICYSGHVAIYMGNNRVIHASTPSTGIKITNNASYRHIVAIRRIFK